MAGVSELDIAEEDKFRRFIDEVGELTLLDTGSLSSSDLKQQSEENLLLSQWFMDYRNWLSSKTSPWIDQDELLEALEEFTPLLKTFDLKRCKNKSLPVFSQSVYFPLVQLYISEWSNQTFFGHSYGTDSQEKMVLFNKCAPLYKILNIELLNMPTNEDTTFPKTFYRGTSMSNVLLDIIEEVKGMHCLLQNFPPGVSKLLSITEESIVTNFFSKRKTPIKNAKSVLWKLTAVPLDPELLEDFERYCPLARLAPALVNIQLYTKLPEQEWLMQNFPVQINKIDNDPEKNSVVIEASFIDCYISHNSSDFSQFLFWIIKNISLGKALNNDDLVNTVQRIFDWVKANILSAWHEPPSSASDEERRINMLNKLREMCQVANSHETIQSQSYFQFIAAYRGVIEFQVPCRQAHIISFEDHFIPNRFRFVATVSNALVTCLCLDSPEASIAYFDQTLKPCYKELSTPQVILKKLYSYEKEMKSPAIDHVNGDNVGECDIIDSFAVNLINILDYMNEKDDIKVLKQKIVLCQEKKLRDALLQLYYNVKENLQMKVCYNMLELASISNRKIQLKSMFRLNTRDDLYQMIQYCMNKLLFSGTINTNVQLGSKFSNILPAAQVKTQQSLYMDIAINYQQGVFKKAQLTALLPTFTDLMVHVTVHCCEALIDMGVKHGCFTALDTLSKPNLDKWMDIIYQRLKISHPKLIF